MPGRFIGFFARSVNCRSAPAAELARRIVVHHQLNAASSALPWTAVARGTPGLLGPAGSLPLPDCESYALLSLLCQRRLALNEMHLRFLGTEAGAAPSFAAFRRWAREYMLTNAQRDLVDALPVRLPRFRSYRLNSATRLTSSLYEEQRAGRRRRSYFAIPLANLSSYTPPSGDNVYPYAFAHVLYFTRVELQQHTYNVARVDVQCGTRDAESGLALIDGSKRLKCLWLFVDQLHSFGVVQETSDGSILGLEWLHGLSLALPEQVSSCCCLLFFSGAAFALGGVMCCARVLI